MDGREAISSGRDFSLSPLVVVWLAPFLHRNDPVSHKRATKLAVVKMMEPKNMVIATVVVFAPARA